MPSSKILDLKKTILADNDKDADLLRETLSKSKTFYINIMSSPGSGKTTFLLNLLPYLKNKFNIGIMEADIDSDVDTEAIRSAGFPAVQLHTGGMCHLDADMSRQGISFLEKYCGRLPDIVILENVGNLVCPAEFDTGAHLNICILAVPEGDDKPLKYPLIFQKCSAVIINKTDTQEIFDFNISKAKESILMRNKNAEIFPVSSKNGNGIPAVADYIIKKYAEEIL